MSGKLQIINPEDLDYIEQDEGVKTRKLATKANGSSRISFEQAIIADGLEVPGVVYEGFDEIVYVLTGKGEITADGQKRTVGPGSFFFVPDGAAYDFKVIEGPMEMVAAFSPPHD